MLDEYPYIRTSLRMRTQPIFRRASHPHTPTDTHGPAAVLANLRTKAPPGCEAAPERGKVVMIEAADGFPLAVERFEVAAPGAAQGMPIVLCPGFGGNRFNFDLDETHSFARHLADEGFDVWIVELRGSGRSKLPKSSRTAPSFWTIDDHVEKDVPRLLDAVTRLSGQPRVVWIGHSLGGMVAYCFLARHPEFAHFFAGLVTIGSPAQVERPRASLLVPAATSLVAMLRGQATISVRPLAKVVCSAVGRRIGLSRLWRRWANPENVIQAVIDGTVDRGLDDLSLGTLYQWLLSMRYNSLVSCDGSFDYFVNLKRLTVPLLLISGLQDQIAPSHTILTVFDSVGAEDKTLRAFGRQGFEFNADRLQIRREDSIDYGHEDLLVGEASRWEVFPYISSWLRGHTCPPGVLHAGEH